MWTPGYLSAVSSAWVSNGYGLIQVIWTGVPRGGIFGMNVLVAPTC